MSGDFASKFIWACAFLFVYSLAGEIFLFKIVKMDLTNSQQKNSPRLFDKLKRTYISDHVHIIPIALRSVTNCISVGFLFTLETNIWAHFLYRIAVETLRSSRWYVTIRFYSSYRIYSNYTNVNTTPEKL